MQITAQMVKELRDKTGTGMMKCKEALVTCNGNVEEAVDYLRKKGLASADKRSGRTTSQGVIVAKLSADRRTAALVEVNCETDFVARNEEFVEFANSLVTHTLENPAITNMETLQSSTLNNQQIDDIRKSMIAKTGENIAFGRAKRFAIATDSFGVFDYYIHGEGNIASMIHVSCENQEAQQNPETVTFAHEVALQAAAMKPSFLNSQDVPADLLQREKEVIAGQIKNDPKNASKPADIIEKIVEGRLAKYYKENCLNNQAFFKDETKSISDLASDFSKTVGSKLMVADFTRWEIGQETSDEASSDTPQEASAS